MSDRLPPPSPDELEADELEAQAQLEASKRLMNYLLLGLGAFVVGVIVFGLVQMVRMVVENS